MLSIRKDICCFFLVVHRNLSLTAEHSRNGTRKSFEHTSKVTTFERCRKRRDKKGGGEQIYRLILMTIINKKQNRNDGIHWITFSKISNKYQNNSEEKTHFHSFIGFLIHCFLSLFCSYKETHTLFPYIIDHVQFFPFCCPKKKKRSIEDKRMKKKQFRLFCVMCSRAIYVFEEAKRRKHQKWFST